MLSPDFQTLRDARLSASINNNNMIEAFKYLSSDRPETKIHLAFLRTFQTGSQQGDAFRATSVEN